MEGFGVNPIKIDTINNLISEFHNFKYIKEESSPSIIKIEQVITKCGGKAEAVFGGFGGAQLIDELELGSSGSLVASEFVDILVKIYEAWNGGAKAESIYLRLLPALVYETKLTFQFWLSVLQKRGIIENNISRSTSTFISEKIHKQIDGYIDKLKDLMVV